MGTGEIRVERSDSPAQLEREVEQIRDDLTGIIRDLDRRRHELLDWRLQLKRHPVGMGAALGALLLLVGGTVVLAVRRNRHQQRVVPRVERLRKALSRMVDVPDPVAAPAPSAGQKALVAAVSTAAGVAAKAVVQRFVRPLGA